MYRMNLQREITVTEHKIEKAKAARDIVGETFLRQRLAALNLLTEQRRAA